MKTIIANFLHNLRLYHAICRDNWAYLAWRRRQAALSTARMIQRPTGKERS